MSVLFVNFRHRRFASNWILLRRAQNLYRILTLSFGFCSKLSSCSLNFGENSEEKGKPYLKMLRRSICWVTFETKRNMSEFDLKKSNLNDKIDNGTIFFFNCKICLLIIQKEFQFRQKSFYIQRPKKRGREIDWEKYSFLGKWIFNIY